MCAGSFRQLITHETDLHAMRDDHWFLSRLFNYAMKTISIRFAPESSFVFTGMRTGNGNDAPFFSLYKTFRLASLPQSQLHHLQVLSFRRMPPSRSQQERSTLRHADTRQN